jgi:ribosomal protein L29
MLLIALMLTGCGQIKNFIHSEINADLAEIKAELAALKAKNTEGWWNWRLSEDGWMSWVSVKTIAVASASVLVLSSAGYMMYKGYQYGKAGEIANEAVKNIGTYDTKIGKNTQDNETNGKAIEQIQEQINKTRKHFEKRCNVNHNNIEGLNTKVDAHIAAKAATVHQ